MCAPVDAGPRVASAVEDNPPSTNCFDGEGCRFSVDARLYSTIRRCASNKGFRRAGMLSSSSRRPLQMHGNELDQSGVTRRDQVTKEHARKGLGQGDIPENVGFN